jgi:ESS family glutamate:Na+ symporter
MSTPFSFEPMLMFGALGVMLLIGTLLRSRIRFFQNYLIPSCLIGGLLGLILMNIGVIRISSSALETAAYHFFNISYISIGLTSTPNSEQRASKKDKRVRGALWMALTQSAVFPLQAALGGLLVMMFAVVGIKLFPTFGFFIPLGFEEGPGQALSFGKVWESVGFDHAATIGLSFATIGFFFSFFVGVPLVNWGIRKGLSSSGSKKIPQHVLTGIVPPGDQREAAGKLSFHSGNVDTLAFHSALIGLIYLVTYLAIRALGSVLPDDVASMLWAFFFILGLGLAYFFKGIMARTKTDHVLDPGIQRRITGWSVDFLIVATIMAIKLAVVWQYLIPIGVMSLSGGIITTLVVVYLGNRLWSYNLERTAAVYGAVTGTVSCGLLLLRIVDPEFKTPVSIEIAIMNVFSIPVIGLCTVLVNGPIWWQWPLWLMITIFCAIMLVAFGLLKVFKLTAEPKV